MPIRRRYFLFLCSACGEQHPFAGFCDSCGKRLEMRAAIPVTVIEEFRDRYIEEPLSVPGDSIEQFVESLQEFAMGPSS